MGLFLMQERMCLYWGQRMMILLVISAPINLYGAVLNGKHLRQFEKNVSTLLLFIEDCGQFVQALKESMEGKANDQPMQSSSPFL